MSSRSTIYYSSFIRSDHARRDRARPCSTMPSLAALPLSLPTLATVVLRSRTKPNSTRCPPALPHCLHMSTIIYFALRSTISANLHPLGPRRTRSSAGARRYVFRFDPCLSSSSNDCSHPPPTDSSRLTNVLSVYSLHKTFLLPARIRLFIGA